MREKHFSAAQMLGMAILTAALTLGGVLGTLWALLGEDGLAVAQGWAMVRTRFVGEYESGESADAMLKALVDSLGDRWSYYLTVEDYSAQTQRRSNRYVGIGVTINYLDERGLTIVAVQSGGPAEAAGLQVGEIITAADGHSLAQGERGEENPIQGEEGTFVELQILSGEEERTVSVERRQIQYDSVSRKELLGEVAYLRLDNFYSGSGEELNAAVDEVVAQGAKAILFDVRGNGGGYVKELTAMLDHLLPEGPVFRMVSPGGKEKVTSSDEASVDLPMAILVDSGSYSAAEFFAAQLRESAGARVIGGPTSGKGYSQQALGLWNGGALNLSTNQYTTGKGTSLVGTGVELDEELTLGEQETALHRAGLLPLEEDEPLQKGLEWLREIIS